MTIYEQNIVQAFKDVCKSNSMNNIEGASPSEVTNLLAERNQLSKMDSVIDIADIMRGLRGRGYL